MAKNTTTTTELSDVAKLIYDRWNGNHQTVWFVGDEFHRYFDAVQEAARAVKDRFSQTVKVIAQDKLVGFYDGKIGIATSKNKTNQPINALQIAMGNRADIEATNPDYKMGPRDNAILKPEDHAIIILKDWDAELAAPAVQEFVRNIVQSNMCSGDFYEENKGVRGRRMIIFITTSSKALPGTVPEVKPIHLALPDEKILTEAVHEATKDAIEVYAETKGAKGIKEIAPETMRILVDTGKGMTYQAFVDAMTLAIAKHGGINDLEAVINTIEDEKALFIANVPGLTYVPRRLINDLNNLPGYEELNAFIDSRNAISPEMAAEHNIDPIKGVALGGAPGLGKTMFGMLFAKRVNRLLLILSLGEVQGSYVGESEANMRRVLDIAKSMGAVLLVDDVDKAGISAATGAKTTSMEGGPFGRLIQILLTEMSTRIKGKPPIFIFTFNRVINVPGELLRKGRIDERFFVDYPNAATREQILSVHLAKRKFPVDRPEMLRQLAADDFTNEWSGAELEDLVHNMVINALGRGQKVVDWVWGTKKAKETKPMCQQDAYKNDIQEMRDKLSDFVPVGKIPETIVETPKAGRTGRQINT